VSEELTLIMGWIESTLKTDATVSGYVGDRVYEGVGPDDCEYPFIVYQNQSADDVRGVGTTTICADTMWLVKAIAESAPDRLAPVAAAITDALTLSDGIAITGGSILSSVREQPFFMGEVDGSHVYNHLGGTFAISAQAT